MQDEEKEYDAKGLSTQRTGEQFWQDLMKKPYNEDKAGQSFVTIYFRRRLPDKKDSEREQVRAEENN
jgi:hypothetical protein